ncbi:hypothetical protein [Gordonia jacobaea]|uniref:hypothetical protein n=1 Tax=Gordonia jacobaea TaxID=122202 RepID=UPI003D71AABE
MRRDSGAEPTTVRLRLQTSDQGQLRLVGYTDAPEPEHVFFAGRYKLGPMLAWLHANESAIRLGFALVIQASGETLGQTFARARDAVTDDLPTNIIDLANKSLAHYNRKHNIAFGAPGTDIPQLLLGRGNDEHEICNYINDLEHDTAWRYRFDPDDFFSNLPTDC